MCARVDAALKASLSGGQRQEIVFTAALFSLKSSHESV